MANIIRELVDVQGVMRQSTWSRSMGLGTVDVLFFTVVQKSAAKDIF